MRNTSVHQDLQPQTSVGPLSRLFSCVAAPVRDAIVFSWIVSVLREFLLEYNSVEHTHHKDVGRRQSVPRNRSARFSNLVFRRRFNDRGLRLRAGGYVVDFCYPCHQDGRGMQSSILRMTWAFLGRNTYWDTHLPPPQGHVKSTF